jgi:hypothetical protein
MKNRTFLGSLALAGILISGLAFAQTLIRVGQISPNGATTGKAITFDGANVIWGNPIPGTHSHPTFSSSTTGFVPASGGGTVNFLRADGNWAAPAGGGGGATPQENPGDNFVINPNGQTLSVLPHASFNGAALVVVPEPEFGDGTAFEITTGATTGAHMQVNGAPSSEKSIYVSPGDVVEVSAEFFSSTPRTISAYLTINSSGNSLQVLPALAWTKLSWKFDVIGRGITGVQLGSTDTTSGSVYYVRDIRAQRPSAARGSASAIQFNNNGLPDGDADLRWDSNTNTMTLAGSNTGIVLNGITTEPNAPAPGTGRLYAKSIAGRVMPKWVGPSGVDYPMQSHIGLNNVRMWRGGASGVATTFASQIGSMPYTGASPTAPTIPSLTTTNLLNSTVRSTISTGATAGGLAYIRGNQATLWRGNAASLGGFFVVHRFALSGTLQAGMRVFSGVVAGAANPTNIDPITTNTPGGVGLAANANTGNWSLVHNVAGTPRTAIALGASFPINNTDLLELALFSPPNGSSITYRVSNLTTNVQATGTISSNIPTNVTFLTPSIWVTNNATAAAQTLDFVSTYVETDY